MLNRIKQPPKPVDKKKDFKSRISQLKEKIQTAEEELFTIPATDPYILQKVADLNILKARLGVLEKNLHLATHDSSKIKSQLKAIEY